MPPVKKTVARKLKKLSSVEHHCSQCNRSRLHEILEHEDGVTMKCPCGYSFVDVRVNTVPSEITEVDVRTSGNDSDES